MKKCDNGIAGLDQNWAKGDQKRLKSQQDMRKAIEDMKKEAAAYTKLLDDAIDKEIKDKDEKTVYYRGMKMLKAKLAQYQDSYEQSLAFDQAEVSKEESYVDKHWKIAEQKLKAAISAATAAAKTAAAEVAKNGDEAWPEFITQIPRGIRELSWAFNDVRKARENGVELADPAKFETSLSQLESKLPNRPGVIDAQQMLAFTKALAEIVKAVKAGYRL